MFRRLVAFGLIATVGVFAAEPCLGCTTQACCYGEYSDSLQVCQDSFEATVGPLCVAALVACACAVADADPSCAIGCLAGSAVCLAVWAQARRARTNCQRRADRALRRCLNEAIANCT